LKWIDVHAAYALTPTPLVHEARVGLHTPGFHWIPDADSDEDRPVAGVLVTGGVVRLPALYYYGVEGGAKKSFRAEAQANLTSDGSVMGLNLSLRYNEPDTLATFPYAQDAWNLYFSFQGALMPGS
jgi:hypothetical protein